MVLYPYETSDEQRLDIFIDESAVVDILKRSTRLCAQEEHGVQRRAKFRKTKPLINVCLQRPCLGHLISRRLKTIIEKLVKNKELTVGAGTVLSTKDVKKAENAINSSVKVNISQGQFDALVSLIYNWGAYNFKISKGLQKLNARNYSGAADEFFSKERGIVQIKKEFSNGLYRRRQAELALWQS